MDVTVALVGDPDIQESYNPELPDAGVGTPYAELRKVTLDVAADDTLRDVLVRAARQLSLTGPGGTELEPSLMSFYEATHEDGYDAHGERLALTLVDLEGRALWGVHVSDPRLTMAALLRSKDAGLIDGDPRRPYLLIRPIMGNGLAPDWQDLVLGFLVVREILGLIADGVGVAPLAAWTRQWVREIRDRIRRTPDVIDNRSADWAQRGGWPYAVEDLIQQRLWKSDNLAPLLGITVDEVDALLAARGMIRDKRTGFWHLGEDPQSRIVHEVYEFTMRHEWSTINDAGELERRRAEIRRIVTRGMEPEPDESDT